MITALRGSPPEHDHDTETLAPEHDHDTRCPLPSMIMRLM
jgi:hypothetical protein